ncbi:MAG: gluconate 2-dehydrogenase subunit 3 family protein [Vicinamibacterales bacterium]
MGDGGHLKRTTLSRREFGKALGVAGAAQAVPAAAEASTDTAALATQPPPASPPAARTDAYTFFTADEARFVDAAIARLVPSDELGPGAADAGVTTFIDRQLSGTFGSAGKWYMRGPWGESTPEQGYQLPLTPRQLYRLSIDRIDRHAVETRGSSFHEWTPAQQDAWLSAMERGDLPLADVPVRTFFEMLLANTLEGFFADPVHGGNRDKVGWRLVGFPGVAASYFARVDRYNEEYRVEPVSIVDVLDRRVRQDEHGHVVHERLDGEPPRGSGR